MKRTKKVGVLIFFSASVFFFMLLTMDILSILSKKEDASYGIINIYQAKERFDDQSHLFLDARGDLFYGLGHIKKSISFPLEKFDQTVSEFKRNFAKDTKIVVYCDGSLCSSSYALA